MSQQWNNNGQGQGGNPQGQQQPAWSQPQQPNYPQQQPPQQPWQPQPQQGYQQPPQGYPQPQPQQGGFGAQNPQWDPQGQPQQLGPTPGRIDGRAILDPNYRGLTEEAKAQAQKEMADAEARRAGAGSEWKEWKPLGPNGEEWAKVPWHGREWSTTTRVWLCGNPEAGRPFVEEATHFWISQQHPKGFSCACLVGREVCPVCAAKAALYKSPNKEDHELLKKWKLSKKGLWNIFLVDDWKQHQTLSGKRVPLLWRSSESIAEAIEKSLHQRGGPDLLRPREGRPWLVTKTQTGPDRMNVEWSINPELAPEPLHEWFWPAFENLNDLRAMVKRPNANEMHTAIMEIGYPLTDEARRLLGKVAQDYPEPPALSQAGQQQGQPSYQQGPGQNPNNGYQGNYPDPRQQVANQVRGNGNGNNGRW